MQATQSTSQAGERTHIITGMRRVSFYTASPVETCDRCSQGIKHVAVVEMKDGTRQKYGMDCINKILAGDNSLKSVFAKNQKLLKRYTRSLEILSMPIDQMPRGSEYYDSGLFFVGQNEFENGKGDVFGDGHWFFHPLPDVEKNLGGGKYPLNRGTRIINRKIVPNTPESFKDEALEKIEKGKVWFSAEIERISTFLARVLNSASSKAAVSPINADLTEFNTALRQ